MTEVFEIVFSFDTTGSMFPFLNEVRKSLKELVEGLKKKIPGIRIAIFAHGDYCDAKTTYVTKWVDFTNDSNKLCSFIKDVGQTGGGDAPECYELVMRQVQEKLSWSDKSQKALIIIGDAVPHEKSEAQNYLHIDWKEEVICLREKGIKMYAVQCSDEDDEANNFYQYIASRSFGYHQVLDDINKIIKQLTDICYREAGINEGSQSAIISADQLKQADTDDDTDSDDADIDMRLKCCLCKTLKPPDEFPTGPLTKRCQHFPGICLRCVVQYVRKNWRCPMNGCGVKVDTNCKELQIFEETLGRLFLDYTIVLEKRKLALCKAVGDAITVSSITGDTVVIPYKKDLTVDDIAETIAKELQINEAAQKIFFKERCLKTKATSGKTSKLSELGIQANEALTVIKPLYSIPKDIDHVILELSWEFPKVNPDFLDASCFAFEKEEFIQVIDWNHPNNDYYLKGSVKHSATNEVKNNGKVGHQTIHVHLKQVPNKITHLFFSLSSWKAASLSSFSNPCLQFYDASNPEVDLCNTTFTHALTSQAVILCYIVRSKSQWEIFEFYGKGCVEGNAKKYNPIRKEIINYIKNE